MKDQERRSGRSAPSWEQLGQHRIIGAGATSAEGAMRSAVLGPHFEEGHVACRVSVVRLAIFSTCPVSKLPDITRPES